MRILYIDTNVSGHHVTYMSALIADRKGEAAAVLPEAVPQLDCPQIILPAFSSRKPAEYFRWLKALKAIVEKEKPDAVHFLYGDVFYRFFGLGLGMFKKYAPVITLHWMREGFLGRISTRRICKKAHSVVVHTAHIARTLKGMGVGNAVHVEYPHFDSRSVAPQEGRKFWNIPEDAPVIACIGGTRSDKGLDLLLEALKEVKQPFRLLVAGKEDHFKRDFIEEKTAAYADRVCLALQYLSDEELAHALGAADVIALPYRRVFSGASGPLGEGAWLGKYIVGPDHGSLGDIIRNHHLGGVFAAENVSALTEALEAALSACAKGFEPDEVYRAYRAQLQPESFVKKYREIYASTKY